MADLMAKPPAFQFYPKDWLTSEKVMSMTLEQQGAYMNLLCHAWINEGLPNDDAILARLSGMGDAWLKGGSRLVRGCFKLKGDRLINEKQESIRENQKTWREKSRLGGIESGKARSKAKKTAKGGSQMAEPKANTALASALASKDLNTQSLSVPPQTGETDVDRMAIAVYEHYKKMVKAGAREVTLKHIRRILKTEGRTETDLISTIDNYTQTDRFRNAANNQFYIEPSNFFGQSRRFEQFLPTDEDVVLVEDTRAAEQEKIRKRTEQIKADREAAHETTGAQLEKINEKLKG